MNPRAAAIRARLAEAAATTSARISRADLDRLAEAAAAVPATRTRATAPAGQLTPKPRATPADARLIAARLDKQLHAARIDVVYAAITKEH